MAQSTAVDAEYNFNCSSNYIYIDSLTLMISN